MENKILQILIIMVLSTLMGALYYEHYKIIKMRNAINNNDMDIIRYEIDRPFLFDNKLKYFQMALLQNKLDVIKLFVYGKYVDPSFDNNAAFKHAILNGHTDILKILLKDERTNPSVENDYYFANAITNGEINTVKILLEDGRINPGANNNTALITSIIKECDIEQIKLLINHKDVDPSDSDNFTIHTIFNNLNTLNVQETIEIIKLLLLDTRVINKLSRNELVNYIQLLNEYQC
jgi:hypothetical protein